MANYLLSIAHQANQQFVRFFFSREMYSQYMYILNKYYIYRNIYIIFIFFNPHSNMQLITADHRREVLQ